MKALERWWSDRLGAHLSLARWGSYGTPVLLLPTAGGDAEEVERNGLVDACGGLLSAGRIKLYSCDSVAGHVMLHEIGDPAHRMAVADAYHHAVRNEVLPAIAADCGGQELPIITAGASIGAFNAVSLLCRFPDVVRAAIGMSGTYSLQRFYDGQWSDALYHASAIHFLPGLSGPPLDLLRQRFVVLAAGQGPHENIAETWRMAEVLGASGVPNRVDPWGPEWPHDWQTWRAMLPRYLDELT
jgi:esterase/lipase superfamily enzyme